MLADARPELPGRLATGVDEESEVPNVRKNLDTGGSPPSSRSARSATTDPRAAQDMALIGSDIRAAARARLDACHAETARFDEYCGMRQVLRRVDAKGPIDRIRGATADRVRAA